MKQLLLNIRRTILRSYRLFILRLRTEKFNVGKDFFCGRGCIVSGKNTIQIGDNFYMGNYCHLATDAIIGDDVLFASFVALVGGDHKIDNINTPIRLSGRDELRTIHIEDNVWVGHGAIIIHGVTLKSGAVIASGAVVTKDVPANAIVGGNPAKLIRYRKMN